MIAGYTCVGRLLGQWQGNSAAGRCLAAAAAALQTITSAGIASVPQLPANPPRQCRRMSYSGSRYTWSTAVSSPMGAAAQPQPTTPGTMHGFATVTAARRRDPRFGTLSEQDVAVFREVLGEDAVITQPAALQKYNRDWMRKFEGASQVALLPQTTQQVAQVLAHCGRRRLAVVPQGGNTSLAGAAVPCFDEVILTTAAMNTFQSFDKVSGVVVCGAGCTLQEVDDYVRQHGFMVPLDLGAKQTCHIGGNVATNAGGLRYLRYGSMRANVLGIQAVTPTGTMLDLLSTCKKDNTGYDLKQLFIGSEGTLGAITAVALACPPMPAAVETLCLACADWDAVITAFHAARRHVGEALSAFEFFDEASLDIALRHVPGLQHPTPDSPGPFYVILEAASSDPRSNTARLEAFLSAVRHGSSSGGGGGGLLGGSGNDAERAQAASHIWSVRKNLSEGLRLSGDRIFKYDLSLAPGEMYDLVEETRRRLAEFPDSVTVGYGHLGDGNLHLNVAAPSDGDAIQAILEPFLYEYTWERGGSISAEHGLGQMKNQYMRFSKPPAAIEIMHQIKHLFDPSGIMNPYKLLPPT